jgi:hypothetical protein
MGLRAANDRKVEAGAVGVLWATKCSTERHGPAGLGLRQDSRQEERRADVMVLAISDWKRKEDIARHCCDLNVGAREMQPLHKSRQQVRSH